MRLLANILWIFFGGGIILFLEYLIGGFLLCITIIGIPFGIQKLKLAVFALAPFGMKVVDNYSASGCLAIVFNILWILLGGFWIAVTHLILALVFFITIIGIPFSRQHIKMAGLAIAPFGRTFTEK
jgi:uncharacterized membrane protein YccF (DUF307 family)